tara:strand:- start:97 stop:444 length:348 start_codon:yes stop_codon:yes gene_type:complete
MEKFNFRPWGWWKNFLKGPQFLGKVIHVKKNQQLSLQRHKHRNETWIIADGEGEVFVQGIWQKARQGKCVHIPVNGIHRVKAGKKDLVLIELQFGEKISEDDIERLEDDYGRIKK